MTRFDGPVYKSLVEDAADLAAKKLLEGWPDLIIIDEAHPLPAYPKTRWKGIKVQGDWHAGSPHPWPLILDYKAIEARVLEQFIPGHDEYIVKPIKGANRPLEKTSGTYEPYLECSAMGHFYRQPGYHKTITAGASVPPDAWHTHKGLWVSDFSEVDKPDFSQGTFSNYSDSWGSLTFEQLEQSVKEFLPNCYAQLQAKAIKRIYEQTEAAVCQTFIGAPEMSFKNKLDDVQNGDRILSWYSVQGCPYSVHVVNHWPGYDFEIWYRGNRLNVVEEPIKLSMMGEAVSKCTCQRIAELCRKYAHDLGHITAERLIEDRDKELTRVGETIRSLSQDVIKAGAACEEARRNVEQTNKEADALERQVHGLQVEKSALHTELQTLRDRMEDQTRRYSLAWEKNGCVDMLGRKVFEPIPELERLRRKNAMLEREASNLRVERDTLKGKLGT